MLRNTKANLPRAPGAERLLLLIIAVGIIAKAISFLVLPESAYNDSIYHLNIIREAVAFQTFSLSIDVPPPAFHAASTSLFAFSGLAIDLFAVKLLPFLLLLLQLLLGYMLFRKIFPENPLPAFAFLVVHPWLTRFGGINYPEALAAVAVMASLFLILKMREEKNPGIPTVLALAVSISIISLSKLNGTILVPAFFLASIYVLLKNSAPKKIIVTFAISAIVLSSFWFGLNFINFGVFDQHLEGDISNFGEGTGFSPASILANIQWYYLYFWDFPNASAFSGISFLAGLDIIIPAIAFGAIVLPLFALLILGAREIYEKDRLLALLIFSAVLLALVPVVQRTAYYRLIIPAVPLLAILFGFGFNAAKGHLRTISLVALLLFAGYSFAYTSLSAYQFNGELAPNAALFEKISGLPKDSLVLVHGNRTRDVEFFTGIDAVGATKSTPEFIVDNADEFYSSINNLGITHIAVVCYKDPFNKAVLSELEGEGRIANIFEKDCTGLFEVR